MAHITTIGLDIGKDIFRLHGVDAGGVPMLKRKLNRNEVAGCFRDIPPCLIGIEACAGSNYWGQLLSEMGHTVRLVPARYVKPYVKIHKNDANDAEAICEAITRPNMRFVPIKTQSQQSVLVLHRVRDLLVRQRTMLMNALRGHLAEFGIVRRAGRAGGHAILQLLDGIDKELTREARASLRLLTQQVRKFESDIARCEAAIAKWHKGNTQSQRLSAIPGIGPMTASAIVATVGDARRFRSGRQFAAWIGLVPRQYSSGGVSKLMGITRVGDRYLRKLLFMGASSALRMRGAKRPDFLHWAESLRKRKPYRVAVIALAAKLARVAWAVLVREEAFRLAA
jgi:transposase